jgi:hypothetical protein
MTNLLTPTAGDPTGPGVNVLLPGQELRSFNGTFQLAFQPFDGNLVLYINDLVDTFEMIHINRAIWAAKTDGRNASRAIMQTDGNFVVYDNNNHPLFATNTSGHQGAFMIMQDDGNLVVYTGDGQSPLWASHTSASEAKGVNAFPRHHADRRELWASHTSASEAKGVNA